MSIQCRPTLKGLIGQLENVRKYFGGAALKVCYEASYVGFSLQRDLQDRGYPCEVVSPSSIPRRAGKAVKTDRIDAAELADRAPSAGREGGCWILHACGIAWRWRGSLIVAG